MAASSRDAASLQWELDGNDEDIFCNPSEDPLASFRARFGHLDTVLQGHQDPPDIEVPASDDGAPACSEFRKRWRATGGRENAYAQLISDTSPGNSSWEEVTCSRRTQHARMPAFGLPFGHSTVFRWCFREPLSLDQACGT